MLKPVLLVEDNAADLDLALIALARTNLPNKVVTVRDGEEALAYLLREGEYAARPPGNPAVVLLDLKLPKVDGIEVLRLIRTSPHLKDIPVVMLTSSKKKEDLARAYRLNVNAYVIKPLHFGDFIEAVRELGVFWAGFNQPPPAGV